MNEIFLVFYTLVVWSMGVVYGAYKTERRGQDRSLLAIYRDWRNA